MYFTGVSYLYELLSGMKLLVWLPPKEIKTAREGGREEQIA